MRTWSNGGYCLNFQFKERILIASDTTSATIHPHWLATMEGMSWPGILLILWRMEQINEILTFAVNKTRGKQLYIESVRFVINKLS